MSELDTLLQKKENLLAKVQRITESCEGIENEENAAKVAELNGRQAELLAQKEECKGKLSAIDGELGIIGQNIRELSGSGVERILEAIENQRWYFFKNQPKVLLDRDTGLLWANLDYFSYLDNGDAYATDYDYDSVRNLISVTNGQKLGGCQDWRIPTNFELWDMICDKTFPFQEGDNRRIKDRYSWCVLVDGVIHGKDLDMNGADEGIGDDYNVAVILCTSVFVPQDYVQNISPDNTLYTEQEKLQMTLNIFTQNELIPIFEDEEVTKLYRQIYVDKPLLLKQLAEVETEMASLQQSEVSLTVAFDYKTLLAKYDVKAVDSSVIQYYEAVRSVTDNVLDIVQEYETAQSETISEFSRIALQLDAKYTDNPHLSDDENSLLCQRQRFLAERLELGLDEVKEQILSMREQADDLAARLNRISHGKNAMRELAELENEPRVRFAFLVENLARIVREAQQKVNFFILHRSFITNIIKEWEEWSDDYKAFKTNKREELISLCLEDSIDEEVYSCWYEDWRKKRFIIEQRFLPLLEFALKGSLLSEDDTPAPAEQVLHILQSYKDALDSFYLQERKNIYQKFAFQAGGDLQEKFETESELYKLAEGLQRNLSEVIFACKKTEERVFLLRWSEPLLNVAVDEIISFVQERELAVISVEVMEQFAALKRQNFAAYLADSQAYSEALQKREKEYNALVFRMRKDLQKQ